jgi:ribonuclease VapC
MAAVVVDTSAAVAIVTGEPATAGLIDALEGAERRTMSAATRVGLGIVLETRFGPVGAAIVERFVRAAGIEEAPFDTIQADLAVDAWRRFGRGRHAAGLNLGDCFTYALAASTGSAVLCVGDDFPRTDIDVLPAR